ncbi:hypothetical protein BJF85_08995 [Saccharomonospora sp. CUA-673]|uniref:SAM-dependent methyltransferase n=1 Tax=Saccharomonospora sp. CUA-673 TaxID=1904969 RepID=UPI000963C549|nr:class I SAM-dependent methyltransferase [Saccharomonospora sp. CUA-673]OLT38476.1 hypothetical protein BJF85_08995 [Saccharomonospora sp. CUA-673]
MTDPDAAGDPDADRARWNGRYRDREPSFAPHPLLDRIADVAGELPAGPVLELACGPSGSALALAAGGRDVTAVDVSDVALEQLRAEAERRGLGARITCVRADACEALETVEAGGAGWACVLSTLFWDPGAFAAAADAVTPGGVLAWEALRLPGGAAPHPYRIPHGTLAERLPAGFTVLEQQATETTTGVLARRAP